MKHYVRSLTKGTALTAICAGLALFMFSCLNPIGFSPEVKLTIDANVKGEVDTRDITAATLYIVNGSKTADFTFATIRQSGNMSAADPYATIDNTAKKKMKARHIQASDIEYEVKLECVDPVQNPNQTFILTVDVLAPTARTPYYVYLYRDKDSGDLVLVNPDNPPLPVPDPGDSSDYFINIYSKPNNRPPSNEISVVVNINGSSDDETNINVYEGGVDITLPTPAQTVLGSFIVKNVSKDMDVNSVQFTKGQAPHQNVESIANGPPARNQQSIVLRNGQWAAALDYGTDHKKAGINVQVAADANPASIYNILYFYKTNRGSYDLTASWPPVPNDAAGDNITEADLCGPNQGILRVINKSSKWWIEDVIWLGETKPFQAATSNENFIVLPIGAGKMQFTAAADEYKLSRELSQSIEARKTTTVIFDDGFMTGPSLPRGGTRITLVNDCSAADVSVTGVTLTGAGGQVTNIASYDFKPAGEIPSRGATGGNGYLAEKVLDAVDNTRYEVGVQLVMDDGSYEVVWKNVTLYNKAVTFTVSDVVVEQLREHKGTITVSNNSDARVIGLEIYSLGNGSAENISSASFVPSGDIVNGLNYGKAVYTFYGTSAVPLTANTRYNVNVLLARDGYTGILLVSGGKEQILYDRGIPITINQQDITPEILPPPASFVPLTSIYNIPSQMAVSTSFQIGTPASSSDVSVLYGARAPTNANAYTAYPDVKSSGNSLVITGNNTGTVTVSAAATPGTAKLTISIPDGAAPDVPLVRDFNIQVISTAPVNTFVNVADVSGPPATMAAGSKAMTTAVYPPNATNQTVSWQILNPLSGDSVSGSSLNLLHSGNFTVRAKVTNGIDANNDGTGDTDFTKDFPVIVQGGLVKVTVEWTGSGTSDHRWAVDAIEVVKRPASVSGRAVTNSGLTGVTSNGNLVNGHTGLLWSAHEIDQNNYYGTTRPVEHDPKTNENNEKVLRIASPNAGAGVSYDGFVQWHLKESVNVGVSHYNNGLNNKGDYQKTWPPYTKDGSYKAEGQWFTHPNIEAGTIASHYPGSIVWDASKGGSASNFTWNGSGAGSSLGSNGDKSSFYLKDDGTVYWLRIRMRYADDAVGVWYKAWTLQEWFALDFRTHSARITNGELKLYTRNSGEPYFRFVK
jgi:hypothetical protein